MIPQHDLVALPDALFSEFACSLQTCMSHTKLSSSLWQIALHDRHAGGSCSAGLTWQLLSSASVFVVETRSRSPYKKLGSFPIKDSEQQKHIRAALQQALKTFVVSVLLTCDSLGQRRPRLLFAFADASERDLQALPGLRDHARRQERPRLHICASSRLATGCCQLSHLRSSA